MALVLLSQPAFLRAQSSEQGPAVIPGREAYLDLSAPSAEGLLRWVARGGDERVIAVHFEPPPYPRPAFWESARWALLEWSRVPGLPLRFDVIRTAHDADLWFRWIGEFGEYQAGTTEWRADADGSLTGATVTLAMRHADGLVMSDEFLRMVALHEVGHALGLPHSEDPKDVMHPGSRNSVLSPRDVRSLQELYAVSGAEPAEDAAAQER
jgi:hypothetical protein